MQLDRRDFIKHSSMAGLGMGLGLGRVSLSPIANAAASDTVVAATIGIHSRGKQLTEEFARLKNCRIKYVVDVDKRYLADAAKAAETAQGLAPEQLTDFRKALDDKDIDAVVIATPDHWQTPMSILALKAGKHVYVEKPSCHNPAEAKMLVEAQKKYGRLVQIGTQRRSTAFTQQMISEIHAGIIGTVYMAKAWYANKRKPIGFGHEISVPDSLDWELYQGPAPHVPYRSNLHPYNWHWFWHWGTGEALNNGTHHIDIARWALDVEYPKRVSSLGGRYHHVGQDDWECPDTQTVSIEYEGGKLITWEGRSCNHYPVEGQAHGIIFYGTGGTIIYLPNSYKVFDEQNIEIKQAGSEDAQADVTNAMNPGLQDNHAGNFVEAVLGKGRLSAPIEEGQKSVLAMHLANIALRTGSVVECDPKTGSIIGNPAAQKLWGRVYESAWAPTV